MKRIKLSLLLLVLAVVLPVQAAEVPVPPSPARWVTDSADFISPQLRTGLDRQLEYLARSTGTQILVWIGTTTGDTPTEDWTVRAFERWKVGQKGLDNGLVLFIFAQDKKVRIEVGYGLEDRIPDVTASRIIRNVIVPRIQAGDNDGAVMAGVQALVSALGEQGAGAGAAGSRSGQRRPVRQIGLGQIIVFVILGIGFLFLLITNPTLALYLLFSILSGGRGGGGGFGGGGFSGGGGRSGGGGATGSW